FFQAEDGIRDFHVTGVQTCALPISRTNPRALRRSPCAPAARTDRRTSPFTGRLKAALFFSPDTPTRPIRAARRAQHALLCIPIQIGRASCRESVEIPSEDRYLDTLW